MSGEHTVQPLYVCGWADVLVVGQRGYQRGTDRAGEGIAREILRFQVIAQRLQHRRHQRNEPFLRPFAHHAQQMDRAKLGAGVADADILIEGATQRGAAQASAISQGEDEAHAGGRGGVG